MNEWGLPGGPVVKNPPSSAGTMGLIPGQGTKIPHCRGATKPTCCNEEPVRCNEDPAQPKY